MSWIIVALALLLPISIPVRLSTAAHVANPPPPAVHDATTVMPNSTTPAFVGLVSIFNSAAAALSIPAETGLLRARRGSSWLVLIWLSGIVTLLAIRASAWYQFRVRLYRSVAPSNPRYEAIVAECAKKLQVKARVSVIVTDVTAGPAIGGLWRPYLLIPLSLEKNLSDDELQLVILHELGHWSRRDTAANFLVHCALTLHWFNPAVWFFSNMARLDCELACDEFVLGRTTSAGPDAYGTTILKVLATVRQRNASPVLLGILGRKEQLKRRFEMIARFRTINVPRIIAGWSLIALVAVIAVTGKLRASGAGSATTQQITPKISANTVEMKRYENTEWKFSIEIPTRWNRFPPASANSPYEVVRFASDEGGIHNLLIVFRQPRDPKMTLSEWSANVQQDLARGGFGNFATNKTTIEGGGDT